MESALVLRAFMNLRRNFLSAIQKITGFSQKYVSYCRNCVIWVLWNLSEEGYIKNYGDEKIYFRHSGRNYISTRI